MNGETLVQFHLPLKKLDKVLTSMSYKDYPCLVSNNYSKKNKLPPIRKVIFMSDICALFTCIYATKYGCTVSTCYTGDSMCPALKCICRYADCEYCGHDTIE